MHDFLLRNASVYILLPILYASRQQTAKSKMRRKEMPPFQTTKNTPIQSLSDSTLRLNQRFLNQFT